MLHTVNKSPSEKNSLLSCLRLAQPGSDILLIEDGVYAALAGSNYSGIVERALMQHRLYVLEPDLASRGFGKPDVTPGVQPVSYSGFVDLTVANDSVHAWL